MLTQSGCIERLRRFRERLTEQKIDAAAITDPRDIYYLTGSVLPSRFVVPAFLWVTQGTAWLVSPTTDGMRRDGGPALHQRRGSDHRRTVGTH